MNIKTALYVQAIRGPVLLVTVGILFAIHQAGILSFSRTWPLLIIVIGVMKLLERAWAPVSAWQTPAMARHQGFAAQDQQRSGAPERRDSTPQSPGAMQR
jgi:hypothetical protein